MDSSEPVAIPLAKGSSPGVNIKAELRRMDSTGGSSTSSNESDHGQRTRFDSESGSSFDGLDGLEPLDFEDLRKHAWWVLILDIFVFDIQVQRLI